MATNEIEKMREVQDNTNGINYNDKRLQEVKAEEQAALNENAATYGEMINASDKFYQNQIDAAKDYAATQTKNQQEQTDFAIEQIEQQKDQAYKDYTKEQSGAYVDWQKQSNQYGANAEQMAANGMAGTGYSESSQVSMYNTYQNRVAAARESYGRAVLNYNNAIKDARLQNNALLAEIAYNALQTELELSLQGFQYKNQLIIEQANKKLELQQFYHTKWQDVLNQMNVDREFEENVRQFDKTYELDVKKYNESVRQFNQNYKLELDKYNEGIRQFNLEIERLKKNDANAHAIEIEKLELSKASLEEEKRQFNASQKLAREELAEKKRQFNVSNSGSGSSKSSGSSYSSSKGSSSSKSSSSKSSSSSTTSKKKSTTTTAGPKLEIDMQSVLNLGLGPISESKLNSLVSQGYVKETRTSTGKIKFSWTALGLKNKQMYSKFSN